MIKLIRVAKTVNLCVMITLIHVVQMGSLYATILHIRVAVTLRFVLILHTLVAVIRLSAKTLTHVATGRPLAKN